MDISCVLEYLRYKIFARHSRGHGIHSPFVFRLVSEVFRNKNKPDIVSSIEKTRKRMLADTRSIKVTDLGAGSGKMKSSVRKVSDIARYSSVPPKYGKLLASMASAYGRPAILEFGTSLGISAMYMAASCPGAELITMEGCPETSGIAAENFSLSGLNNITLLTGSFDELLPGIKSKGVSPGMVFIDGNHRGEPLLNYFSQIAAISGPDTVVIIDDIHITKEMSEAWREIKRHEKVSLSVDIFRMGMVFFRKGMPRYDYIIRY